MNNIDKIAAEAAERCKELVWDIGLHTERDKFDGFRLIIRTAIEKAQQQDKKRLDWLLNHRNRRICGMDSREAIDAAMSSEKGTNV